ncbi:MAG: peptide ABC transporter substrate-binding protein [Tissierellia bacterium]|nr:peptide ABC transporter substrate-binding protein [Tissierellia bacterium]
MKKRFTKVLALVLSVMMILTACGPSGNKGNEQGGTKNQDLVVIKNADIMTLDSAKATDEMSFEVLGAVMEGLYVMGENGQEQQALAESVEESKDGLKYTFKLRDAKWSNGDPVTANDFVYAWRKSVDPKVGSEYSFMMGTAGIKNADKIAKQEEKDITKLGVKALDEKTLEVELERRVPYFKKILTFGTFLPQNEKFVTEKGDQYAQTPENLIYNGPFKLTEWISGNSFKAVKNENYWDKDKVKLNSVTWKVAKDSQTAALEFESGKADFVRLSGDVVDRYKGDERLKSALGGYLWFLVHNKNKVPELKNVNLTKAIANAVDRKELAEVILKDGAIGAEGFVPKQLASSPAGKDFREENGAFYNEGPEKAKEYAKKAFEELGITELNIELLFEDTEESKKVAEYIQSKLQENVPGLKVSLKSQPKKSRINLQLSGDFQLSLHRWGPDYPDPMTYMALFLKDSNYNYNKYDSPKYDELVKKADSGTLSDEDRWKALLEAEKELLSEGQGPIPIYQTGNAVIWAKGVKGWIYSTTGVSYYYKYTVKE